MSHVLLTGSTAAQTNVKRSMTFSALVRAGLQYAGHTVDWSRPGDVTNVEQYDRVVVGVSPLLSLSSYYAYDALRLIAATRDTDKLVLLVDAPDPWLVLSSANSALRDDATLFKTFFSNRPGYPQPEAASDRESLRDAVAWLGDADSWPTTIYPVFPWAKHSLEFETLVAAASGVSLDAFIDTPELGAMRRAHQWVTIGGSASKWSRMQQTRWERRGLAWSDGHHSAMVLAQSSGVLLSPYRAGLWWSPLVLMALELETPVCTIWQMSKVLGPEWAMLPGAVEDLDTHDRHALARAQLISYLRETGSHNHASARVSSLICGAQPSEEIADGG